MFAFYTCNPKSQHPTPLGLWAAVASLSLPYKSRSSLGNYSSPSGHLFPGTTQPISNPY